MTIFEALNLISMAQVPVSPFTNYDPTTTREYDDNGCHFIANTNCWPIHSVKYSEQGNLNITVIIHGIMTEPDGKKHNCKQIRTATVVKGGSLNIQYLQLTKNKEEQSRLPADFKVKNNIIDLGQFALTDKTNVDESEMFKEGVYAFIEKLNKNSTRLNYVMDDEEFRLSCLGLNPDGVYNKPVKTAFYPAPEHVCKVSITGCSSKNTKLAQKLKTAQLTVPKSKINELFYTAQVLNIHKEVPASFNLCPEISLTGKIKC